MNNHAPLNAPAFGDRHQSPRDQAVRHHSPSDHGARRQSPRDQAVRHQSPRDQGVRRQRPRDRAGQHLSAIAARLTACGISSRLDRLGGTPVLTIDQPAAGPYPVTVTIDPDPGSGSGLPVDCTCLWTPAPGTTPEATADTIVTVLNALRPALVPQGE